MRPLKLPDYFRAWIAARRDPAWRDMLDLFRFHGDGVLGMQRMTGVWVANYGLRPVSVYRGRIVEEAWNGARIARLLDEMAGVPNRSGKPNSMKTDENPRFTEFPLVIVRTQGREFFIDGRRRANLWRHQDGEFRAWIIEVE